MARLNLEEKLWTDIRFKKLIKKLGEAAAIGEWVLVAFEAQKHWAKGKQPIPEDDWVFGEYNDELINCRLVRKVEGGYHLCGSEEHFDWYLKMLEFGKKGVESRKLKKENLDRNDCADNSPVSCTDNSLVNCTVNSPVDCTVDCVVNPLTLTLTPTPTLTPTLALTPFKKESSKHEAIRNAWNEMARPNGLPSCKAINDDRIKKIKLAEAQFPEMDWPSYFKSLPNSDFLLGKTGRGWRVDFDFAISSKGILKILEGKYDNGINKVLPPLNNKDQVRVDGVKDAYAEFMARTGQR